MTEIKEELENKDLDYVIHGDIVSGYENLDQLLETIPHEFSPDETVTGQGKNNISLKYNNHIFEFPMTWIDSDQYSELTIQYYGQGTS